MKTKIDEVSFMAVRPSPKGLIGFCSCLIDKKISINSIAVYSTPSADIRLLFPSKVLPNSKQVHIVYPINKEVYESIREAVKMKIESLRRKKNEKIDLLPVFNSRVF